jgi:F420-dependent hydroxymycolic acid dehydrogenase
MADIKQSGAPGEMPLGRTGRVNIGYVLSHEQFTLPQLLEWGPTAERAGFDAVWGSDHFQPWQDNEGHAGAVWVTLAALGQQMPRIPLGTGVTCPTFRYHPAIVAQVFSSLSQLYPGRVFLGVGTGEALNEEAATGQWGDYKERAARLVEAVQLIRELWTGEIVNFKGDYYQTKDAKLYDTPARPIPIYIAAAGPKSMRIAGEYGDGLIADSKSAVDQEMRQAFEEGARAAGKDPTKLPIIAEQWVFVGSEQEAAKYANLWRFLPKAWDEYVTNHDPRDIQKQAMEEVPIEKTYEDWAIGEDPSVHLKELNKLIEQGVSTIFVHSAQPDQNKFIDFYSRQVLPKVKRQ